MEGKIAIVTGGASGIGRAIAETLGRRGARVVIADVSEAGGRMVAEAVGGVFVRADLRRVEDCRYLVDATLDRFGTVHVLVNNAGFQHVAPLEEFPEQAWHDLIAVMLTAPFLLTKYVWPAMKAQRWGRVVNIASIHGLVASPFKAGYVAAKHGLIGLTRVAALEGGPYGITVNAICPAYVRTPLVESQVEDQARATGLRPEEVIERVMLEPAAVRRLIEPEEIAAVVAFLCSDQASAVTGAAWTIDLGWTAR